MTSSASVAVPLFSILMVSSKNSSALELKVSEIQEFLHLI